MSSPTTSDLPPAWAIALQQQIQDMNINICSRFDRIEENVGNINATVAGLQDKVQASDSAIVNCKSEMSRLENDNALLKGEVSVLAQRLDEQVDRSLREHLTIIGIPRQNTEKSWSDTEEVLVNWLDEHTDMSAEYLRSNIVRCHRGADPVSEYFVHPVINCRFSWKVADTIFRALGGGFETDSVKIKNKFSKGTQARVNRALLKRKELKNGELSNWKLFIKYPATLMGKGPEAQRYTVLNKF